MDMRAINRLTVLEIKNALPCKYADDAGLWLHRRVDGSGRGFCITVHSRRREMGLGSLAHVGL